MSRTELSVFIVIYLIWILICVSNIAIAKIIKSTILLICIGTLIANNFDFDLVVFTVILFHPLYIKWIGQTIKYLLAS